jgi:hypothetical protein
MTARKRQNPAQGGVLGTVDANEPAIHDDGGRFNYLGIVLFLGARIPGEEYISIFYWGLIFFHEYQEGMVGEFVFRRLAAPQGQQTGSCR